MQSRYDVAALAAAREAHGRELAAWRVNKGLTQIALARRLPTSVVNLRKWEHGLAMPSAPYQVALAREGFTWTP